MNDTSKDDATPMMNAPLAPAAAFVVHLRAGTPITAAVVFGRVEHVASGRATAFRSLEEVRAFMERVLADDDAPQPDPTDEYALDVRADGATSLRRTAP